jgi:hypothetical protein
VLSRIVMLGLCAVALVSVTRAEDIAPGLWELSLDARVDSDLGFQPGPVTLNQCISKDDARDPSKLLGPIAAAGATGCSYSEKSYVGQEFRFTMQCSGTLELTTTGDVTFSATTLRGMITTSSSIDGGKVEFTSALVGRRLGTSAADVNIDTLGTRIYDEIAPSGSVIVGRSEVGAWSRA